MGNDLQLTLLGKPGVTRDGVPVMGFVHKKSLALLCYLAVTGRPHTREALAGLLWGEATEVNARASLRKVLADLRRLVAPHLMITRQQVAFDRARPYWLDVKVFDRRVGEIMEMGERGSALTDEDAAALAAAVELYQGDFLEGFHVRHAPAFEDWGLLERERLRLSALRALHILAAHYTARGTYAQAIAYTGRMLAMEPGQEEAHRQMMSLLALSGQRGAALRQYKTCRRVLAEEWGIEPEEETTALYERIRDGVELHPHTPRLSPAKSPISPHSLPVPLTPLIGREAELAEIAARLRDPTCRLLTLVGAGGSGKTRLALEAAAQLEKESVRDFEHGVYLIRLAPVRSVEAIVPAMAHSLGFYFYKEDDPGQQLLDYVRRKDMLLVMDNFEHLLPPVRGGEEGGVGLVSDVLETAPGVKILATSRARLNLQGEHLFPVSGMDFPSPLPSPPLRGREAGPPPRKAGGTEGGRPEDYSAVQLFVSSARRVRPDLELTADDLADVARICRLVEGMPLGILLAAGWVRILTPAEIAAWLAGEIANGANGTGQGLDLLETDWRDVPARQRSMRAVFDHSWNLVTEREREVLAALSVFRGGFTREAAHQVSTASLRELMALVDQSLLHWTPSSSIMLPSTSLGTGGRYDIHELLRQYAEEKLEQMPAAAETAHDRHSAYFAAALQQWAADFKCARQQVALAEMDVEIANARAAWDWAVAQGQVNRIGQAMEGLRLFYRWRAHRREARSACAAVVKLLTSATPLAQGWEKGEVKRMLARTLACHSWYLSDLERANQLLQESLTLLDDPALAGQDTRAERAFVLLEMGARSSYTDLEQARRLYEQSIVLYQSLESRWEMANALSELGVFLWDLAAYGEAKQLFEKALTIYRSLGDPRGMARSLEGLGLLALFQGQPEGERWVREGIAIHREIGDRASIADGLCNSGMAFLALGEHTKAHSVLEESVTISDDLGRRDYLANILSGIAKVMLGRYEGARACGQMGLTLAREVDHRGYIGQALMVLGWVALAREAHTEAQAWLQESATAHRQVGQQDMLGWVLASLGYAAQGRGDIDQARQHLHEALRIAAKVGSIASLVLALSGMALLLSDLGQAEQAVELYALASRHPIVANSRWFADVVGRHITAVAATLPPDVVAAAQERGRARDMDATVAELLAELGEQATDQVVVFLSSPAHSYLCHPPAGAPGHHL